MTVRQKTGRNINYLSIRIISSLIENYGHRTEVRKSLASNQDWIDQYFGKILPMMSGQTNVGLISMNRPGKPDLIHPEGQGTYLQILKMVKKMFIRWVMKI